MREWGGRKQAEKWLQRAQCPKKGRARVRGPQPRKGVGKDGLEKAPGGVGIEKRL